MDELGGHGKLEDVLELVRLKLELLCRRRRLLSREEDECVLVLNADDLSWLHRGARGDGHQLPLEG